MKDKISVIIPTYNNSKYLKKALDSVRDQTYENYEVIVVDDGSKDNTRDVVYSYERKIKYIYQENGGVAKARNTGIMNASGNYLAFLDSDDLWLPDKLEMQIACMSNLKNVYLTFTNFIAVSGDTEIKEYSFQRTFNIFKEYNLKIEDLFSSKLMLKDEPSNIEILWGNIFKYLYLGNFILPSTVMIRREVIEKGFLFDETYRVAEDTDYFLRISRNHDVGYINYPLSKYNMPSLNNLSGKTNTETLIKNALKTQLMLREENNYSNDEKQYIKKGISKTYMRLAYYYLSELRKSDARKASMLSLIEYCYEYRAILIFLGSNLPDYVLRKIHEVKRKLMR